MRTKGKAQSCIKCGVGGGGQGQTGGWRRAPGGGEGRGIVWDAEGDASSAQACNMAASHGYVMGRRCGAGS